MFLIILIKSLIIGGLVGVGVGAGAARMFHAPTTQGMGAFRTLGELNSCEGDPASHFSFGLGFFFNAWASSVAAGSFTQDVDHRIIPNWGAAALMLKNRNVGPWPTGQSAANRYRKWMPVCSKKFLKIQ
ncbi:inner membrane protein [Klebsiella pneumoniae]|nr:inner membrane protein [Klebsiella pneumoniae]